MSQTQGWDIDLSPTPARINFLQAPGNDVAIQVKQFALPASGGATNAFAIGAWGGEYGWPTEVEFYADRLVFGNTPAQPQTLWFSKTGAYVDFGKSTPIVDDDTITATINARQLNDIRDLVPLSSLLVMTGGGEWRLTGGQDDVLAPATIGVKPQGYHGSSATVPALVVGDGALYVQDRGRSVRDIGYSFEVDGFRGSDLTLFADHLFRGRQIKAWAYQQIPHSIVWVVTTDGQLLSMTYIREQEVIAWARHITDGVVEGVITLPEGDDDAVYLTVERNGSRLIERLAGQQIDDAARGIYLDSHLTYDGAQALTGALLLSGAGDWTSDTLQAFTVNFGAGGSFTSADIGREIVLDAESDTPLRLAIVTVQTASAVLVQAQRNIPVEYQDGAQRPWRLARADFSGLDHLEGKQVSALVDGYSHRLVTVTGGAVVLDFPGSIVHVGLPYRALMETLEMNDPGDEPQAMRAKLIRRVGIKVLDTRGIKAGPDENRLQEYESRQHEPLTAPPDAITGTAETWITADWTERGHVVVVQDEPLPLQILSLAIEFERGDR